MGVMSPVIGHRGAPRLAVENSRAAFTAAARLGLTWVETDVRQIADDTLILFHDKNLKRVTGQSGRVRDITWPRAKSLGLYRLETLLFGDFDLNVNIELKLDSDTGLEQAERLAEAVADLLIEREYLVYGPKILVSSFHPLALLCFRRLLPKVPLGVLTRRISHSVLDFAHQINAVSVHGRYQDMDREAIEKVIEQGFEVYVYTINDPALAKPLWAMGMTGLFTDDPEKFLSC